MSLNTWIMSSLSSATNYPQVLPQLTNYHQGPQSSLWPLLRQAHFVHPFFTHAQNRVCSHIYPSCTRLAPRLSFSYNYLFTPFFPRPPGTGDKKDRLASGVGSPSFFHMRAAAFVFFFLRGRTSSFVLLPLVWHPVCPFSRTPCSQPFFASSIEHRQ